MKFWFFLSVILDIYPWIFLHYLPFRQKLRFPYPLTMAFCVLALLPYQLGVVWLGMQPWCNLQILATCRMFQYVLNLLLSLWLIRDRIVKNIFVAGMVMPISMFVLTVASYIRSRIPADAPLYMVVSLLRLGLSAALYPFLLRRWKWKLAPAMELEDKNLWNYSWPLPLTVTCVTILYTRSGFEAYGATFTEVMIRLCLLTAIFVMDIMVFQISRRTAVRIHMTEEVERNRLLMSAQREQYRILATGILKTRQDCLNMNALLEKLDTLAGDREALSEYLGQLRQCLEREQPETENQSEILGYYLALAKKEQIPVNLQVNIPQDLGIDGLDLILLLGNLFENAIEANCMLPVEQRKIDLSAVRKKGVLRIRMSNPFDGVARQQEGRMLSRKRDFAQPGVGLSAVWAVADKYNGELRIEHMKGVFTVYASLEEREEEEEPVIF